MKINPSMYINKINHNSSKNTYNIKTNGNSFKKYLNSEITKNNVDINISKHASMRLDSRNIQLTDAQLLRINDGIEKGSAKGIKNSLLLMDNLAFVVNINNKTLITAIDRNKTEKNIFTNIDGAIII